MDVFFLRHAHAIDGLGLSDEHRSLSSRGRQEAISLGVRVQSMDWKPSRIWMSPKTRAVQTCELVLRAYDEASIPAPEVFPELAYGSTAHALSCLERASSDDRVLLVGHEPLIRSMASQSAGTSLSAFSTATGALVRNVDGATLAHEIIQ